MTHVPSVTGLSVITIKPQDNYTVCTAFIFFTVPFNEVVSCWDFITSVNERIYCDTDRGKPKFRKETCPAATSSTTNPTRTGHDWTRTSAVKGWQLTVWAKAQPFASSFYSLQRNLNQRFLFFKDVIIQHSRETIFIVLVHSFRCQWACGKVRPTSVTHSSQACNTERRKRQPCF
jgi:hypothetical protein